MEGTVESISELEDKTIQITQWATEKYTGKKKTEQILRNPLVYKKRSNICVAGITGDEKEGKAEKCLKKW